MKSFLIISFLLLFGSSTTIAQAINHGFKYRKPVGCTKNLDTNYSRKSLLQELADTLNKNIPDFAKFIDPLGFYIESDRPKNFFVYDLTDTLNKSFPFNNCIDFVNNHVYHFASLKYQYSFSFILILTTKSGKIFKEINCINSVDNLDSVLRYCRNMDTTVLNNIRNYRKFGIYFKTDPQATILCN